jgi:cytochrome b561
MLANCAKQEVGMAQAIGFSRGQIALHWGTALLVLGQYVFHDAIVAAFRAAQKGQAAAMTPLVWGHIIGGIAILLLVMMRLQIRAARGVPALPNGSPIWVVIASRLGHLVLYGLLFLTPVTGIVAWFGGSGVAGDVHGILRIVLFFVVAAHLAGALFHLLIRRDGVTQRMFRAG